MMAECGNEGLDEAMREAGRLAERPLTDVHGPLATSPTGEYVAGFNRADTSHVVVGRRFDTPHREAFASPGAVPGLLEFPQALPPHLVSLVSALCVGIIASRVPNQLIGRRDSPYIDRWLLARKCHVPSFVNDYAQEGELRVSDVLLSSELENLYLHRYARGDADEPHDHPWPNASLVVRGWYAEAVYDEHGRKLREAVRRPGDIVLRSAGSIHAILETSGDCLSLFATMRKERDWGFWRDGEFVPWQDFRPDMARPV